MWKKIYSLIFFFSIPIVIQSDLTNLNEILNLFKSNSSKNFSMGSISQANADIIKRYLPANVVIKHYGDREHLLQAINNESVIGKRKKFILDSLVSLF